MADIAKLTTKDLNGGLVLSVTLSRAYTIRMKLGCWLIGIAGRVMDMPCEIEVASREGARD